MTQFFSELASDAAAISVYIAILVLFAVCLIKCIAPVITTRRLLYRAVRQMKKGKNARLSWQDEGFLGKGALFPHWREYLNNLFFADGEFHNPSSVEDFINEETAIYAPGRAQLADAAPGLMVSLGFLGTLIGMTTGLSGFNMDSSEAVMDTIRQLVPGVRYAFTTSIVGVVASIVTTLVIRITYGSAHRALNRFYGAMSEYAGVASVNPMTQIAIYQQEQTALISRMAEGFSGDTLERTGQAVVRGIAQNTEKLQASLDNFISFTTREQTQAVDMLVERFMQQLNDTLDGQLRRFARTLEDTARNQAMVNDYVRQAATDLNQAGSSMAQAVKLCGSFAFKLDEYLTRLGDNARQAQESHDRLEAAVEHMDLVSGQQNKYLLSITQAQAASDQSRQQLHKSMQGFTESFTAACENAVSSMEKAADSLARSGDVLAANHQALVGGISHDIDQTYNHFFKTTNDLVERLNRTVDEIKNSVAPLPDTLDGAADLYTRQAQQLTEALIHMQNTLGETAQAFRNRDAETREQ